VWRASVLAFVLAVACEQPMTNAASWTADTGIYGTYDHFGSPPNGPATFICGIGYDLRYGGSLPLDSIDVAARFPQAFRSRVGDPPEINGPGGWVTAPPVTFTSSAHPTPPRPAALGHASGTLGTICPGSASDLDTMKGTLLRLRWTDRGVDHEEQFVIDRVRGNVKVFADQLSTDGLPRLEWER
jgi:hypothetical protein